MSTSESNFLNLRKQEYCNHVRHGTNGDWSWLISSNLTLRDFVKTADFKKFRVFSQSVAGPLTTNILRSEEIGYAEFDNWYLSEPISTWISSRKYSVSTCFILRPEATKDECRLFAEKNDDFFNHLWEHPPEPYPVEVISGFLQSLNAIAYMQQSDFFALVASQKLVGDFVGSPTLLGIEERRRLKMIELRQDYIANCGPEIGPEKCLEYDCEKLRIKVAARCLEHQFFAFNK